MESRKSHTGHNLFTDVTWHDEHKHWQTGMTPEAKRRDPRLNNWMAQHDLEVYLSEGSDIPLDWARTLIPAALNGMPVTITRRLGREYPQMTVTETGIVTSIHGPNASHFYWRTWGGSHPVYFSEVVTLHTPETVTVLHTDDGDKRMTDEDYHPSVRNTPVHRDGTPVTEQSRYTPNPRIER